MKRRHLIATTLFLLPLFVFSQAKNYYFSTALGDDNRTSVQAQNPATPWKTITKLNSFWSSLNAGDNVFFNRGETFPVPAAGLVINKSGAVGVPINIGAYGTGARPILDGSYTVLSWTNAGAGLYTATIPAGLSTCAVLTMDGVFQRMGKLPKGNAGYYNVTTVTTNQVTGTTANNGSLNFQSQGFAGNTFNGGEICWRAADFAFYRGTINTQTATAISYTPFAATGGGPVQNPQVNFGFFIQNHPATCTQLGEWAYNPNTHVLTVFFGGTGPGSHVVKVSAVQNLINGGGQSNISFSDVDMRYGNTYLISLGASANWTITRSNLSFGGIYGVFANNGGGTSSSTNLNINNCTLNWVNSVGVRYASNASTGSMISDTLTNIGSVPGMGGSGNGEYFAIRDIKNTGTVRNCYIINTGYVPISFQGTNNTIQNNFIDSFCTILDDGGGIYSSGAAFTGTNVLGNIVMHGLGAPTGTTHTDFRAIGIYSDDHTTAVTYTGNTTAYMGDAGYYCHSCGSVTIRNNTFFSSTNSASRYFDDETLSANIYYANNTNYADLNSQFCFKSSGGGHSPTFFFSTLDSNRYCRPTLETTVFQTLVPSQPNMTLAGWKTFIGKDAHSVTSPKTITDTTQRKFFYNNTLVPKTFSLGNATYIDLLGNAYAGNVTLQPWTSIILLFNSNVSILNVTVTAALNPVACFGNTTTITANGSGGSPPYTYSINGGAFSSTNVFTNRGANTYSIVVKDATGATATGQITITQPTQITITETHTAIVVNGNPSTVTGAASGGTVGTGYSYKIDNGNYQTSPVFTGVLAGPHTLTVRDANLCTNVLNFTITQPTALTASASNTAITCFNGLSVATITASGATPPYTYSKDGVTFQASNQFTNLPAQTYSFTVKDAAGALFTFNKTITQPTQITITETHTAILVNGNTSTVTAAASNGTPGYNYKLDNGSYQGSPVFAGVLAGPHTLTVRDANLCTNTFNFTITQPAGLTATASFGTISCFGGNATGTITASGGTPPYRYSRNGTTFQASNQFTGLTAQTYTFTVRDAAGALFTFNSTLSQPAQITITETHTAITINGNTSTVTGVGGGGTGILQYKLDNGSYQGSPIFAGVSAGPHTLTVRDANLCTNVLNFTITQPSALTASAAATTNPLLCNGNTTTGTVTASGGTPPYQYKIGTGSFQSSNSFTGLGANSYTFTITDAAGAITTTTLVITQPNPINISLVYGTAPTTVTANATGGTAPLQYKLDNGAYQPGNSFAAVASGPHTITVRDNNNCTTSTTFTVTQGTPPLHATISAGSILCNGGSVPVTIGGTGGVGPYTVSGGSPQTKTAGTYKFTVTDALGSTADTTITLGQPALIIPAESHTPILINGNLSTVTASVSSGGVAPFQYKLDNGSYQSGTGFTSVAAGNHRLTVKDNNNCTSFIDFTITQPEALGIGISFSAITCYNGMTTVTVSGNNGTLPYRYSKDGGTTTQATGVFTGLTANTYTFSVIDTFGARKDTIVTIGQPTQILVAVGFTAILTNGGTSNLTVTASQGTGTLEYKLDNGAYQPGNTFTGLLAGPHVVTVRDANLCTNTNTFTIDQPGALLISSTQGPAIACYNGTTSDTLVGSGGTPPYRYSKDGGTTTQATGIFTGLSAGTYTFSVIDTFGAQKDTIVLINQPTQITIAISFTAIVAPGGTSTITVTAANGTPGYTYKLDNGGYQGGNTFAGTLAGPHVVTVKDANTCTNTNTFTIGQPGALGITATPVTDTVLCYGDTTSVNLVGSGGTTPYRYGINGTFQTSPAFHALPAGTYTFSILDTFNVRKDTIITIHQPALVTVLQVIPDSITVFGGSAPVQVLSAGGTPVNDSLYYYKLDAGGFTLSDSAFSYTFPTVTGGNHTITVKDANNCTGTFIFNMVQPIITPNTYIRHRRGVKRNYKNDPPI